MLPYCYLIDVMLPVTKLIYVCPKLRDTDVQNSHVDGRGLLAGEGREISLCIPVSTKEICHRIDLKSLESSSQYSNYKLYNLLSSAFTAMLLFLL